MKCPISGVNVPRFLSATVAGMIVLFAYEFFVHAQWLMPEYEATESLWRSDAEMEELKSWSFVRLFLLVATIGYLYTKNHEGKGAGEGLRFGFAVGLVLAVVNASAYLWMPISADLALSWGLAGVGTGLIVGLAFSLVYTPCKASKKAAPAIAAAPAKKAQAKKAPAKRKTAAKKVPVKKAPAKKATAKKAPAKKAAPKKKTAAKKTTTKRKTAAKKAPVKKATAKKSTAKKSTAKKTTAKKTVAKKSTAKRKTATKKKTTKK